MGGQNGEYEDAGTEEAKGTYLLLRDVQLVPLQHHITVFPNLPENPFPAEFPDPADLLGRRGRVTAILKPLPQGKSRTFRLGGCRFPRRSFRPSRPPSAPLSAFPVTAPPEAGLRAPSFRAPLLGRLSLRATLSPAAALPLPPHAQLQAREARAGRPGRRGSPAGRQGPPSPPAASVPAAPGFAALYFISHCLGAAAARTQAAAGRPGRGRRGRAESEPSPSPRPRSAHKSPRRRARAHSPSWWNCSSSSFRVGAGAGEGAGWRSCPRRRRSSLPLPDSPLLCSSGYTKGRPPSHSHTHARPLPAPRRPPSRRPRGPGPARPRRQLPGPARCGRPGPRPAVPSAGPLTLRVQNKGRIAEPEMVRSPTPLLCF